MRVKPNTFTEHKSTCPNYKLKSGEPDYLEYRVPAKNKKNVQVFSLTFVKNDFFENAKNYQEGELFKKIIFKISLLSLLIL